MLRSGGAVLGVWIDALSWEAAIARVVAWGEARTSRYICVCNAHSLVTAGSDPVLRQALNEADLATSDGAPVAWALRRLGFHAQQRINGPDLMWSYLRHAEAAGQGVYFYGSTPDTLASLRAAVAREFPRLRVVGSHSPAFGSISAEQDQAEVEDMNRSGANVVFVGLGCPKQERWMASHRGKIHALMIGVGAAFDYHAGTLKRAPLAWQNNGLEWLYRLRTEPRRLARRYMVTNTLFLIGIARQFLFTRASKVERRQF